MITVCKRLNNKKRANLLVNTLQAKHVPCVPSEAMDMFNDMVRQVYSLKDAKNTIVVGFAETATAIGAYVAACLNLPYIHTTRETIFGDQVCFKEEHSHAPEHNLLIENLRHCDHVLFVEDEVTTGNTIRAAVHELRRNTNIFRFTVLSYMNCMTPTQRFVFEKERIEVRYAQYMDADYKDRELEYQSQPVSHSLSSSDCSLDSYTAVLGSDPRYGVNANVYAADMKRLVDAAPVLNKERNILVIGTEECMYPAICLGRHYEEQGHNVLTHSTSRSPIGTYTADDYPIRSRYELNSFYDSGVRTYVYNLKRYDKVIIVTDATNLGIGMRSLVRCLRTVGNKDISLIQILHTSEQEGIYNED